MACYPYDVFCITHILLKGECADHLKTYSACTTFSAAGTRDLHFKHESELPICWIRGLNPSAMFCAIKSSRTVSRHCKNKNQTKMFLSSFNGVIFFSLPFCLISPDMKLMKIVVKNPEEPPTLSCYVQSPAGLYNWLNLFQIVHGIAQAIIEALCRCN